MTGEGTTFTMGSDVLCTDGSCGVLRQMVLDPGARALTYLVVKPGDRELAAHLVPIGLVRSAGPSIELNCSLVEFDHLDQAREPGLSSAVGGDRQGYERGELLAEPARGLGADAADGSIGFVQGLVVDPDDHCVTHLLAHGVRLALTEERVRDLSAIDPSHQE